MTQTYCVLIVIVIVMSDIITTLAASQFKVQVSLQPIDEKKDRPWNWHDSVCWVWSWVAQQKHKVTMRHDKTYSWNNQPCIVFTRQIIFDSTLSVGNGRTHICFRCTLHIRSAGIIVLLGHQHSKPHRNVSYCFLVCVHAASLSKIPLGLCLGLDCPKLRPKLRLFKPHHVMNFWVCLGLLNSFEPQTKLYNSDVKSRLNNELTCPNRLLCVYDFLRIKLLQFILDCLYVP